MTIEKPISKATAILAAVVLLSMMIVSGTVSQTYAGNGNPQPGVPHDTVMMHIQPMTGNPNDCNGGHSLHIGANIEQGRVVSIPPTNIAITMQDWVQVDNDGDGAFDEDPDNDVDDDLDGKIDEDGTEPGAETRAIDCDSRDGDGKVSMQIRDTDPRKGWISTQSWYMRLTGIPQQNFAFTSIAEHTVECVSVDVGPDLISGTADDTYECSFEQVELANINMADECDGQAVKKAGGGNKAGGKTTFCDITKAFLVDVDVGDDGIFDLFDIPIFAVSCEDNLATEVNETLDVCPLGSIIWDIDEDKTNRPTIQIFISHDGSTQIVGAKKVGRA